MFTGSKNKCYLGAHETCIGTGSKSKGGMAPHCSCPCHELDNLVTSHSNNERAQYAKEKGWKGQPTKTVTFNISVEDEAADDDLVDIIVDVEYTGNVNKGLVLRHLAEQVNDVFEKYLKDGNIKDITLAT